MANLFGQITHAINDNFDEGIDKHSYRKENGREMGDKIFSYSEKFRLKDVAKDFTNHIKENFKDVKQVKDIKSEHVQSFLNTKTNCTQNTVDSYSNSLFKIENTLNSTYKSCNLTWRGEVSIPSVERQSSNNRGVESVMSRQDYEKIISYSEENKSQSGYALQIQDFMGVRVEEVARIKLSNIDLEKCIISIEGKGGKTIEKPIPQDKISLMQEIKDQNFNGKNDRLFSISGASINKQLNRLQENMNLEKHSNHDIRRLIAQEKYDQYRKDGMSIKDAANKTSNWLSHGNGRQDMLERSYIILR